jgi:hypothetical protein
MTASTWTPAYRLLASDRTPTRDEVAIRDDAMRLVVAWEQGLAIDEVRTLCSARDRWIATRFSIGSPMAPRLMRMLDALIATDTTSPHGYHYQTRQGMFSSAELTNAGASITRRTDGRIRLLFPVLWPWRRKPDPETGDPGERGEPVYGETADDRHRILGIRQAPRRASKGVLD